MAHEIRTAIDVAAPAAVLWAALTDFPSYPLWNPFLVEVAAEPRVGAPVRLIATPGGRRMEFQPRVTKVDPERELVWRGKVLLPGLFDGEHYFRIRPDDAGCRFEHGEVYSGIALPIFTLTRLRAETIAGFEAMNRALKAEAERRAAATG